MLRPGFELFLISFAVLFQELALIRWFPSQVRVIAYFPNLILLSAFLGLGLGCLRTGKSALTWLWPVSLLALAGVANLMSRVAFTENSVTEHLWLLYYDLGPNATVFKGVRLPILVCFLLSTVSFIPLGQMLAVRLQQFRRQGQPLSGYACDILGSLVGVIAFGICGFTGTGPMVWFGIFLGVGALLLVRGWRSLLAYSTAAAALLALVHPKQPALYSPYYALTVGSLDDGRGISIQANGSMHQYALRLVDDAQAPDPNNVREGYHIPYRLLPHPPRRVLVLGAGSGNDVAVALSEGAESVTAVEIDPVILEIGNLHPNRPYADPRVRRVNTDARAFLNESREQFDLIVFGTLDSMTRLSALSNVRLDNFVYTQECVNAAAAHLAPGGGLVMYFASAQAYIDNRHTGMIAAPFRQLPFVVEGNYFVFNRIYLAGPAFEAHDGAKRRALFPELQPELERGELPSDDWPYLYLQARGLSSFYLTLILAIAAISVAAVALASSEMRASLMRGGMDKEMFLFGLAFLLLETKSVTTMSLLWGATWLTSAVVFGAILAMVLVATLLIQFRPLPWNFVMGGLVATLVAAYFVPVHLLLSTGVLARFGLSFVFVGAPIFFAAAGFALLFRDRPEADTAFGWNLLGAVAGGLLEFASMLTGIKALYLLVLVAYLLVMLVRLKQPGGKVLSQSEPPARP